MVDGLAFIVASTLGDLWIRPNSKRSPCLRLVLVQIICVSLVQDEGLLVLLGEHRLDHVLSFLRDQLCNFVPRDSSPICT